MGKNSAVREGAEGFFTIKELPEDERPREKLAMRGSEALSDGELLAIVLRTGSSGCSALVLAQKLLGQNNGLQGLVNCSLQELGTLKGIGEAKAITLKAVLELARRLAQVSNPDGVSITSPQVAAELLLPKMRYLEKEHFIALFLNTKNKVIDRETVISVGSLNASIVHPRELFREAIRRGAATVVVAHNHPSGDPTPSHEDIAITKKLVEAGRLLEIHVLDHIIIGNGKYVSLKEKGII